MNITTFLATFLIYFLLAAIPVMWFIDGRKLKENTLHGVLSLVIAWSLSQFLKEVFDTTRPYIIEGIKPLTLTYPLDGAFPSSHMAATVALSVSVFLHNRKLGFIFLVLSFIIGASRVAAHVHYPIDILGGAILGTIVSLTINKTHLFNLVKKR